YRQNSGTVSASRVPSRSGAIFSASPVVSEISTPTPQIVAGPLAASMRPFGIKHVLHGWSDIPGEKADINLVVGDAYIRN
ncbi:hypothetical protein ACC713_37725, partial [Rhizobium johnstonii]